MISGVTLGQTTTITTTDDMNYVIGQEIRLIIPFSFGCYQLNGQTGYVISIPSGNQIIVSIDSSVNVSNFKSSPATTVAQIVAIGDLNFGFINQNGNMNQGTYVPGSFINISPL